MRGGVHRYRCLSVYDSRVASVKRSGCDWLRAARVRGCSWSVEVAVVVARSPPLLLLLLFIGDCTVVPLFQPGALQAAYACCRFPRVSSRGRSGQGQGQVTFKIAQVQTGFPPVFSSLLLLSLPGSARHRQPGGSCTGFLIVLPKSTLLATRKSGRRSSFFSFSHLPNCARELLCLQAAKHPPRDAQFYTSYLPPHETRT